MGLKFAYVDNTGHQEPNPRFYRTAVHRLAKLQKAICTAGHAGTWEQSLNAWGDLPSWAVGAGRINSGGNLQRQPLANLLSNGESIEPRIPRLER